MAIYSAGVRGINGYNPKEGTPEQRITSSLKTIKELEFKLAAARKILAAAERQLEGA